MMKRVRDILFIINENLWLMFPILIFGDYLYIPAGVPHLPYNPSETDSFTVILARTDPNEQESVELRPDLEGIHFKH